MMTRTAAMLLSLLSVVATLAQAAEPPRQRILLDAGWRFQRGEAAETKSAAHGTSITHWRWREADAKNLDAAKMAAPGLATSGAAWKDATTGTDVFRGRVGFAWFRTVLPEHKGPGHILHFDSVDDNATVYLNGQKLLHHEYWNDPFDVNLGPAWREGKPNELAVLVENTDGGGGIMTAVTLGNRLNGPASGPAAPDFDDHAWRTVHLPHDFIIEGTFDAKGDVSHGSLPKVPGWYRLTFNLPAADEGKSLWIDFDGVYRESKVWLNGHLLGRHASGYTSFRYDIGPYVNCGGPNVLAVSVDPRQNEGWWYEGGGIYRHVWLNVADPVHLTPWGTFVTAELPDAPPAAGQDSAKMTIKTSLSNTTRPRWP